MPVIRVAPCGDGWAVTVDGQRHGGAHASGRAAEAAARALAAQLVAEGRECLLRIELRDQTLAAELRCRLGLLGPVFTQVRGLLSDMGGGWERSGVPAEASLGLA
jgi:hypothetical protein